MYMQIYSSMIRTESMICKQVNVVESVILTDDGIKEAERLKGILLRAVSKTYGKEGEKHHDFTSHRC